MWFNEIKILINKSTKLVCRFTLNFKWIELIKQFHLSFTIFIYIKIQKKMRNKIILCVHWQNITADYALAKIKKKKKRRRTWVQLICQARLSFFFSSSFYVLHIHVILWSSRFNEWINEVRCKNEKLLKFYLLIAQFFFRWFNRVCHALGCHS